MILEIAQVLDPVEADEMLKRIAALSFAPGPSGWATGTVKHNAQAVGSLELDVLTERIAERLLAHDLFALAARPKRIIGPLISRYEVGQRYGAHVDDPILDGARADLAFTLFLDDPAAYDGGDLILTDAGGEQAFKLAAGHLVLYPATTLHHVAEVTRGSRHAAVGWVRSHIRRADQRELLFDLDTARRTLFERHGKTNEFDLLTKTSANLVRMWAND
jgi:PKHD-type hydroxylase